MVDRKRDSITRTLLVIAVVFIIVVNSFKVAVRTTLHRKSEEEKTIRGRYFFVHMEVGYSTGPRDHVTPRPEWSGPYNTPVLEDTDVQVLPGVIERATREVLRIMRGCGVKGMFLAFPYFAEKHGELLRKALSQGHIIGIHMHENWKTLTSKMNLKDLMNYMKSEKARLEKAVGTEITVFSYGPGIQFDDMGGREPPPYYGSLTNAEKAKLFQAVRDAGFEYIQTAREYRSFMPLGLKILADDMELIGLPHSFEWHTQTNMITEVMDSLSRRMR